MLEWAEGGELFAHLASLGRVLADAEARTFFVQIAAAVLACHQVRLPLHPHPLLMHLLPLALPLDSTGTCDGALAVEHSH